VDYLPRDIKMIDLVKWIGDIYFPNGLNAANNVHLSQCHMYVATFSGESVEQFADLTFGDFRAIRKSSPCRLYLHTKLVSFRFQLCFEPTLIKCKLHAPFFWFSLQITSR
jgi:hypothetical protein